ncbi:MAG TPA: Hsp70 family protein, partial [Acidobacteriaceae bacterium]|nr:Hsp70 family protein [Acidobacteriaceae bacterium]
AREQRSGQAAEIDVKPTYGLTDEQVETMILASFDHAEEDITNRQLIEARNEAETIIAAVEKGAGHPAWQQLTPEEFDAIANAREKLDAARKDTDHKAIRDAIGVLDQATRRFAELMMDSAVSSALKGQTMAAAGDTLGAGPAAPHPFAPAQFEESKKK